ncbi:RHS repeat-associated core domain-containing protein [Kutzneria kofuensis]|uniref:RHS repeat domain-containing protein n=1 Tax=Kutzneria kofuensis TaxID=103725 RepID=UPI0031ED985A
MDKVDGLGPLLRYRVTAVVSETGGVTTITYADPDCSPTTLPAKPETNTQRCYPAKWAKKDFSERTDYFNKYVVAQVAESDMIAANTEDVTSYSYLDGAAWAYDTSEFTKDADRNWNEFRGYGRVRITKGKADDPAGPQTMTEQRFYRGMDGDHLPTGARSVTVTDSEGGVRKDDAWLQGFEYESQAHNGTSEQIVSKSVMTPSVQGPTATRGNLKAYLVKTGTTVSYAALSAGGWRTTRTELGYDDLGQVVSTNDLGDVATAADDRCTRTTYARNTDKWLISYPSQTETVSVACTATAKYPDNAVSGTRNSYDGNAFGTAPSAGDVTKTEVLDSYPATGAVYITSGTAAFDAMGRKTATADALGRTTTTAYTPATGGPLTQTVVTNPLGQAITSSYDTVSGKQTKQVDENGRVTETAYDALGNKTEVWYPNRSRASQSGNVKFSYAYHNDAPSVVTTSTLGPNGNYTVSNELYDGLLRLRQTQSPATGGGRLITDTKYDSQGRTYKTTHPYFNDAPVDDKLWVASDVDVPQQTVTLYDGADREATDIVKGGADEIWRTVNSYDGDRVTVSPPTGSMASTAITDARGHTVELRQYHGNVPTGDYDVTTYTYGPNDKLLTTTDPAGNTWRRSYDLRGNQTRDDDVDKGTSTMTYDAANELLSSTDARGTSLFYDYDKLGRKLTERTGSATGTIQAQWTYDTAPFGKGQPATSTRYVNGKAYTSTVLGYNALDKAISTQITIPDSEGALAGTYTTSRKYNVDGTLSGYGYAAAGDLPAESLTLGYDDLAQLTTLSGGLDGATADYVTDTQYTRYGEVARTQLGDTGKRVWLSNYYDDHTRRLTRAIVDAEVPSPMQSDVHYSYDKSGNITSIADTPQGKPADVQCFTLDYQQRITEAWTPAGDCSAAPTAAGLTGPAPYWQSFTYDKIGNRLTETQHAAAGDTVSTGAFPAAGHSLTSVSTTGPGGPKTSKFVYDATGNTITRELPGTTQQLVWDGEGRLAKVTQGSDVTEFVYDADGSRLIRRDATGSTLFLDGQELQLTTAGAVTTTRYYQCGGSTVAVRDHTGLTWLASDHQGTAQISIDSNTLKVTQRRQTPFGEPRGGAVDFPGDKGFVGGTIDKSVGLTELGAREYDPTLGRFLSVDPQMDLTDPQQLQGYTYADNNPISKMDPSGKNWLSSAWNSVTSAVGTAAKAVGSAVASGASYVYNQVKNNKGLAAIGLGMLAICIPATWPAAIAMGLAVASTGLTVWDMKDLTEQKRAREKAGLSTTKQDLLFGVDAVGLALGGASAAHGSLGNNIHDDAAAIYPRDMGAGRKLAGVAEDHAALSGATNLAGMGTVAEGMVADSCIDPGPTAALPCAQKVPDPLDNNWCSSSGMCVCVDTETAERIRGQRVAGPPVRRPSYNLGPQRGPSRSTYGSAEANRTGIYQTTDGFFHRTDGHGLAFF